MAANITIGSLALASNGLTLTGTLSGGTGTGYAPSSGVTGLTVKTTSNGGATFPITSTAISSTTLTINLAAFVASGETVTLDLSAASNLSDSGSNTATGQTAVAVTNNSTQSVARADDSNTAVQYYGRTTTPNGTYRALSALNSEAVFVVNATDATARVYGTTATGAYSVSIDGGAPTTLNLTVANANATIPLFSGLSAGDHTVVLKSLAGTTYILRSNFVQAAGGTGIYRAAGASDGSGYGTYLRLGDAGFASCGSLDSLSTAFTSGSYTSPTAYHGGANGATNWLDARFRVRGKGATLRIWTFLNGSVRVWDIDGVKQGAVTIPNTQLWGWVTIGTGLDTAADHLYGVTFAATGTSLIGSYTDAVMFCGTSPAFSATSVPALDGTAGYGDSITSSSSLAESTLGWVWKIANASGTTPYTRGIAATLVVGTGTAGQARTADITGISPLPSTVFVLYGTNDLGAAGNGSSPSSGFGTAFQAMLNSLLSGTTTTRIIVLGILPRTGYSDATITAWNGSGNGIQGSIAAVIAATPAYSSRLSYFDTSTLAMNGVSGTDYTTNYIDGLHINATGASILASGLTAYFDTTAPGVPANLAAKRGDTIAYLTWSAATGGDVAGYKLRRNGSVVYNGSSLLYLDTGLTNGTTYSYTIAAYDEVPNESAESSTLSVTPGASSGSLFVSGVLQIH